MSGNDMATDVCPVTIQRIVWSGIIRTAEALEQAPGRYARGPRPAIDETYHVEIQEAPLEKCCPQCGKPQDTADPFVLRVAIGARDVPDPRRFPTLKAACEYARVKYQVPL